MKRILVIDESEVVRDTLALILGRDFLVVKKALARGELALEEASPEIDLMILGVAPGLRSDTSRLRTFATRAPFAVLFLVDSKSTARAIEDHEQVGCLAKPFNPYELKEKVGQLLAGRTVETAPLSPEPKLHVRSEYLEFPFVPRAAAALIPRYAATPFPVLICGETGCGQDRVARAIAEFRTDADAPVAIEGAAVSSQYLAQKRFAVAGGRGTRSEPPLLLIENAEQLTPPGQSLLLGFIEQVERERGRPQVVATAKVDLLERVYNGEFSDSLYARMGTLTLKLKPLRERRDDLPALVQCIARSYANELGLGDVVVAAPALERLQNYLWFGNLTELEMVIARTLAVRRSTRLDAADLVFEFGDLEAPVRETSDQDGDGKPGGVLQLVPGRTKSKTGPTGAAANGRVDATDLSIMLHELAHELKNPMVTIKTFAQLLNERYQDEDFRTRFEGVVSTDIERMDDLLESLVEFADFMQPQTRVLAFDEVLRTVISEMNEEFLKRQVKIRWRQSAGRCEVRADEAQAKFVLRNILMTVLSQVKPGTEVEIDAEKPGAVSLTFVREMARIAGIRQYFITPNADASEGVLPLRILLAKHLVERNHGRVRVDDAEGEKAIVTIEFPAQG